MNFSVNILQWPVTAPGAARPRPFKDIFDPDVKLDLDVSEECYLVNRGTHSAGLLLHPLLHHQD